MSYAVSDYWVYEFAKVCCSLDLSALLPCVLLSHVHSEMFEVLGLFCSCTHVKTTLCPLYAHVKMCVIVCRFGTVTRTAPTR